MQKEDLLILNEFEKARIGLMYSTQEANFQHPFKLVTKISESKFNLMIRSKEADKLLVQSLLCKDGFYRGTNKHHWRNEDTLYFEVLLEFKAQKKTTDKTKNLLKNKMQQIQQDTLVLYGMFVQDEIEYPMQIKLGPVDMAYQDLNVFRQGTLDFCYGKRVIEFKVFASLIRAMDDTYQVIIFGNSECNSILLINENNY